MISPEKLRIDNWVCFGMGYYQVKGMLMTPVPQFYLYYKAGNEEKYINVQALHVLPIEITEDILVFNGFTELENKDSDPICYGGYGEFVYEDDYVTLTYYLYSNNFYVKVKGLGYKRGCSLKEGKYEIRWVHELQNILSMLPNGSKNEIKMYLD